MVTQLKLRPVLEQIVLELQTLKNKSEFEASIAKDAKDLYLSTHLHKKSVAKIYLNLYNYVKDLYDKTIGGENGDELG